MAESSFLVQNAHVKNDDEMAVKKFPYKILNDLAMKLKAAEDKIIQERKFYEAKITNMCNEIESNSRDASKGILSDDVAKLKQRISDLVYENNR